MKAGWKSAGLILMVAGSMTGSSWAAKPQKAAKPAERFSAMEPETVVVTSRSVAPPPSKAAALPMAPQAAFDPVPSDQTEPLSQRLKLVDALIRRHGRAYDYRIHTVKELEAILAKLDASAAPAEPALPIPSEADETGDAETAHSEI